MSKRVLIVGGVAGGASCAARVRRQAEDAEIVVFDRGPYVSFANCGLPYYVGNVIQDEKKLLVASAELFKTRFNIEVRTENEVVSIDRERREIEVKRVATGEVYREKYDALVLSPGATPRSMPATGSGRRLCFSSTEAMRVRVSGLPSSRSCASLRSQNGAALRREDTLHQLR